MYITEELDLYRFTLTADTDLVIDAGGTQIELDRHLLAALALFLSRRDVSKRLTDVERELEREDGLDKSEQ